MLSLQVCGPSIRLEIHDDGVGFEHNQTAGLGHGLRNMQMRAQKLGGRLDIDAAPFKGTRIVDNHSAAAKPLERPPTRMLRHGGPSLPHLSERLPAW